MLKLEILNSFYYSQIDLQYINHINQIRYVEQIISLLSDTINPYSWRRRGDYIKSFSFPLNLT